MRFEIRSYEPVWEEEILDLSMRAWAPVFPMLERVTPRYVYDAFYPDGWEARQKADIGDFLRNEGSSVWVAEADGKVLGFIGLRTHSEDSMGEVYLLAVDPDHQRHGVATALMQFSMMHFSAAGMKIAMVETGGDPGHAGARKTYESFGFRRWPVARYFCDVETKRSE